MPQIESSALKIFLAGAAYVPLVCVYIVVAVYCWKECLSKGAPEGMHPVAASMGMTFCMLWILVAPFLLLILVLLMGHVGMACWNVGIACLYTAARFYEKGRVFLAIPFGVLGVFNIPVGLVFMLAS